MKLLPFVFIFATGLAHAQALNFKVVGDQLSYRNIATVESNTEFETFTGRTNNVSGSLIFNPKAHTGSGTIKVDLANIDTGIPARNGHMKSEGWLNTSKYPAATFQTTKVQWVKGESYRATGKFTLHGVTRVVSVPVTVKYRAESSATKQAGFKGDVLQTVARFTIKLSDFGIKIPGPAAGKVSNAVQLVVSSYATTKS